MGGEWWAYGVFHPAIGEGGGKDEDVVGCPGVRVDDLFGGLDVAFSIFFKFPLTVCELFWTRPDSRSGTNAGRRKVAACDSIQVARHGSLLVKGVQQRSGLPILARLEVSWSSR